MENYYRITAYWKEKDITFVADSYGYYEKLWQFSSNLVQKGISVLEVGNDSKFLDGNIEKEIAPVTDSVIIKAKQLGLPTYTTLTVDGIAYKAVQVGDKVYVPDINEKA